MVNSLALKSVLIGLFLIGYFVYSPLAAFVTIFIFGLLGAMFLNAIAHKYSLVKRPIAIALGLVWGVVLLFLVRSLVASVSLSVLGIAIFYLGGLSAIVFCGHSQALNVAKVIGEPTHTEDDAILLERNYSALARVTASLLYVRWAAVIAYTSLAFILWAGFRP